MGTRTYEHVVQDIYEMLSDSFEKGEAIELAAILWSIDYRHRLIPEVAEINCALSKLEGYEIVRVGNNPFIAKSENGNTDKVTKSDLELAHKRSQAVLAGNP
jgi:hypothetical protein